MSENCDDKGDLAWLAQIGEATCHAGGQRCHYRSCSDLPDSRAPMRKASLAAADLELLRLPSPAPNPSPPDATAADARQCVPAIASAASPGSSVTT